MAHALELWFDFASTYSYVAAMRVEGECARAGVALGWRPFLLGPIFSAQLGIADSPFNVNPVRGRYMWRDLERLCEKHGIPWKRPSAFPRNSVRAARVAAANAGEPWIGAFVRAVFQASFASDQDIGQPELLDEVLASLRLDAAAILARSELPAERAKLRANTDAAMARGIFGGPTFFAGDEMFFGQDRLEDAIAWASK